jgi:hypothetical protein
MGAEQAFVTLAEYVARSTHHSATDLARQQAVEALKILNQIFEITTNRPEIAAKLLAN